MGLALTLSGCRRDAVGSDPLDASRQPQLVMAPEPPLAERGFIKQMSDTCRPLAIAYFEASERIGRCDPKAANACSYALGYRDETGCSRPTNPDAGGDIAARQAALTAWKTRGCPGETPFDHFGEWCPSSTEAVCVAARKGGGSHCTSKQ